MPSCVCVLLGSEIITSRVLPFLSGRKTCLCTVLDRLRSPHEAPQRSRASVGARNTAEGTSSAGQRTTCTGTRRNHSSTNKCWDSGVSLKHIKLPCAEVAFVQTRGVVCCRLLPGVPIWKSPENIPWVPTAATSAPVIYSALVCISALIPSLQTAFRQHTTKQLMTCFCSSRHWLLWTNYQKQHTPSPRIHLNTEALLNILCSQVKLRGSGFPAQHKVGSCCYQGCKAQMQLNCPVSRAKASSTC